MALSYMLVKQKGEGWDKCLKPAITSKGEIYFS